MGLFDKLQKSVQDKLKNVSPESLIESVQKKIQGAIPQDMLQSMQAKGEAHMEATMTLADVDNMEKQGCDVTELRRKVTERIAREAAEAAARVCNLEKLEPYKKIPRDPESEFYKALAAKAPLIGKKEWLENCLTAPIVYAAVVQAHHGLWAPYDGGHMGAVFVFSTDPARMYDTAWLLDIAKKIGEMKESPTVAPDCKTLIDTLRDDQSQFCFKLRSSLAGDVDAWCTTYVVNDTAHLPHTCLPNDRILPVLLLKPPQEGYLASFGLIPPKYLI